jgi:hypothetical protein
MGVVVRNLDVVRLREPAAWAMVAAAAMAALVGIGRFLIGSESRYGGLGLTERGAVYFSDLANPVLAALLVGAVILVTRLGGPPSRKAGPIAMASAITLAALTLFGALALFVGLFSGAEFRSTAEFLLTGVPMLGLNAVALLFLIPQVRPATRTSYTTPPGFQSRQGSYGQTFGQPGPAGQAFGQQQPSQQQPGQQPGQQQPGQQFGAQAPGAPGFGFAEAPAGGQFQQPPYPEPQFQEPQFQQDAAFQAQATQVQETAQPAAAPVPAPAHTAAPDGARAALPAAPADQPTYESLELPSYEPAAQQPAPEPAAQSGYEPAARSPYEQPSYEQPAQPSYGQSAHQSSYEAPPQSSYGQSAHQPSYEAPAQAAYQPSETLPESGYQPAPYVPADSSPSSYPSYPTPDTGFTDPAFPPQQEHNPYAPPAETPTSSAGPAYTPDAYAPQPEPPNPYAPTGFPPDAYSTPNAYADGQSGGGYQPPPSYAPTENTPDVPYPQGQPYYERPPAFEQQGQPFTGMSGQEYAPQYQEPDPPVDPRSQQLLDAYQQAETYQHSSAGTTPDLRPPAYDDPFGHPQQAPHQPPPHHQAQAPQFHQPVQQQPYQQPQYAQPQQPGPQAYQPQQPGGWPEQPAESTVRLDPSAIQGDALGDPPGQGDDPIDPTAIYTPNEPRR